MGGVVSIQMSSRPSFPAFVTLFVVEYASIHELRCFFLTSKEFATVVQEEACRRLSLKSDENKQLRLDLQVHLPILRH